jgi:hypothetical protein
MMMNTAKKNNRDQGVNKEFQHYIITRFNLKTGFKPLCGEIDESWLTHRFSLFRRFGFPSVRSQREKNFKWLVLFDAATPAKFRDEIHRLQAEFSLFTPLFIDNPTESVYRDFIKEKVGELSRDIPYVMTTRLDSDDMISRDFVQILHLHFDRQEFEFLNLTHGSMLVENRVYLYRDYSNTFISLVERTGHPKTVYCCHHEKSAEAGPVRQIKTDTTWAHIRHEKNVYEVEKCFLKGRDSRPVRDMLLLCEFESP